MSLSTTRRVIPSNISVLWDRLTQRERLLLGAGVLAVSILVPLKAHDWAEEKIVSYATATDAARTARASAETNYPAVEVRANAELARAASWAMQAKSVQVARVLLEEECLSAALKAGVTDADVHSAETIDRVGTLSFVNLEITGTFSWTGLQGTFANLSKARHAFILDGVEVPDGPKPRFRLELRAPVLADLPSK
jgi:hypothetical protein